MVSKWYQSVNSIAFRYAGVHHGSSMQRHTSPDNRNDDFVDNLYFNVDALADGHIEIEEFLVNIATQSLAEFVLTTT